MPSSEEPRPESPAGEEHGTGGTRRSPARRTPVTVLAVALAVLVLDQATKWWALRALDDGDVVPVLGDLLQLRLVFNPGAAFSLGEDYTVVLTVLSGVAVVALLVYAWRVGSALWKVTVGLLLGGAVTHFGDRLLREPGFARGHVVDFIDYGPFVGNVADIALTVGAALVVLLALRGVGPEGPQDGDPDAA